jgi:hypothetical protein
MALLYVRTGSGGTGPAVSVADLGITIATGAGWTLLSSSTAGAALEAAGQFTSRELRDSRDLYDAIRNGDLEWSKDGVLVQTAISYVADYSLTQDFTDDTFNLTSGILVVPNSATTPASGVEGQVHWDSNDEALYMWDGLQWIVVATSSGVNTDHGALTGLGDDDHPQYHDGTLAYTGDLDMGGNDITNVGLVDGVDISAHVADTSIHFTVGSIDHGSISGLGDDDHAQYLLLGGNTSRNMVTGSINMTSGQYFILPQANDVPTTFTGGVEGALAWDIDDEVLYAHDGTQWFAIAPASGIITDHGGLTGLLDDDHTQYSLLAGNLARNTYTGGASFASTSGLILPTGTSTAGQATVEGNIFWDSDDNMLWLYDGTQWISVPTMLSGVLDHGTLMGLGDDDHPQYGHLSQNETVLGTWTFDPSTATDPSLIIPSVASAPTTNVTDGALATVSGVMYVYDGSRSKFLSVNRETIVASKNGNAKDIYLRVGDAIASSQTGIRALRDGTIVGLALQADEAATWTLEVRRNGTVTVLASLASGGAAGAQSTTVNADFNVGDELQFYANTAGVSILAPVAIVEIAWKA